MQILTAVELLGALERFEEGTRVELPSAIREWHTGIESTVVFARDWVSSMQTGSVTIAGDTKRGKE